MKKLWLAFRRWQFEREHPHLSRAWTLRHPRSHRIDTYVVCLDCGQEFEYDLRAMRLSGRRIQRPIQAPDLVAMERAWQDQAARSEQPAASKARRSDVELKA